MAAAGHLDDSTTAPPQFVRVTPTRRPRLRDGRPAPLLPAEPRRRAVAARERRGSRALEVVVGVLTLVSCAALVIGRFAPEPPGATGRGGPGPTPTATVTVTRTVR